MIQLIKTVLSFATLPCLLVSGLICNFFQVIAYYLVRPFNENLFRTLNHHLLYYYWSQNIVVIDRLSNVKCHVSFADIETQKRLVQCSNLVIANHRYDIDWLVAWLFSDKLRLLGNDKALIKSDLLKVPVIGWGWSMADMIVLKRNWNEDRLHMEKAVDRWLTYKNALLLSFLEGTRFTDAKHSASLKFVEEKKIPLKLKHHLLPRTKGFKLIVKKIKSNHVKEEAKGTSRANDSSVAKCGIINMQFGIKSERPLTMLNIILGQPGDLYIYTESIKPEEIPDSDDEIVELLYKIYRKKDELHEYFSKNGEFPGKVAMNYQARFVTFLNWILWMSLVHGTFFYHLVTTLHQGFTNEFTPGGKIFLGTTFASFITIFLAIKYMIDSTKVSRSSNYGINVQ